MNHQLQTRKVNATGGHVGGNAHTGATVAQRLQRMHAFGLRQFTRERHNLKTTVAHPGQKVVHIRAGLAEHDGRARLVKAQGVENSMLAVAHGDRKRAVFDVGVLLLLTLRHDPQRIFLEGGSKRGDFFWHGCREHQRAAGFGRSSEDEFQIFGKAEVQHLISLIQHHGLHARQIKAVALDMVAQTAGGSDDDMRATIQRALFGAIVHAADAGGDLGSGRGIKPFQLACDLLGQFAGGGDNE